MKLFLILSMLSFGLILGGCSQMPPECEDSWSKLEKLAIDSGIPTDALKTQKEAFIAQIKTMSKEDAIKICKIQTSYL